MVCFIEVCFVFVFFKLYFLKKDVFYSNSHHWKMIYSLHFHCCFRNNKVQTGLGEGRSSTPQTSGLREALLTCRLKEVQYTKHEQHSKYKEGHGPHWLDKAAFSAMDVYRYCIQKLNLDFWYQNALSQISTNNTR